MSINLPKQLSSPMGLALRQGVVTTPIPDALNLTCNVLIAGNDTAVTLKYMHHVSPVSGDPVWIMQNGTDMLVVGKTKAGGGGLSPNVYIEGLELYHNASTPYIDFHRAANPAGDSNADYNMRLINDAAGRLSVVGGSLHIDGVSIRGNGGRNYFKDSELNSGTGLRVGAAWGKYGIYAEDGNVAVGAAGGNVYLNDTQNYFDSNGATLGQQRAYTGKSGAHGGWAQWSHAAYWNSSAHYGSMHNGGSYLISADEVILRYQNGDRIAAAGGDVWMNVPLNMRGHAIWMKQYNDNTHRLDYDGGLDGFIFSTWGTMEFWQAGWLQKAMQNNGVFISINSGVGGFWDRGQVRAESRDNGGSASLITHISGHTAATAEHWVGDNGVHWRRSNGTWLLVHADHDDLSTADIKRNIRSLGGGKARRQKMRNVKPKRWKRKKPNDPTAPFIISRHKEEYEQYLEQVKEGRWSPESVAQGEQYWEEDDIGFLVEDIVDEFPEVVTKDSAGNPIGIRYRKLTAYLWQQNQEQEDEIEALEARMAAIEAAMEAQ